MFYRCSTALFYHCSTKNKKSMKQPTLRIVFDRKKQATKEKKALVQIEVVWERKKKYISTGVKLCKNEWNDVMWCVNRFDMEEINERLRTHYRDVYQAVNKVCQEGEFDLDKLERELKKSVKGETFIDYVMRRIDERNDIMDSTKKNHRKLVSMLLKYGKIKYFSDLTKGNVQDFYNYLMGQDFKQTYVHTFIKFLKIYIHDAMVHEIIQNDPCAGLKFKRGESEDGRWLSQDELKQVEDLSDLGFLETARDLFLIQCYTGLAYADLMDFNAEKITLERGMYVLTGKRVKTNADYITMVLPKTKEILEKYDYKIPRLANSQYNARLKLIAEKAGIRKPLASHWGRRTCGMILLNEGYPIEVVSKVLGHTDIRTTQKAYAKILSTTVVDTFKRIEDKKNRERLQ